ncbi:hypothetical protein TTHERM_000414157 (macronuclear) [Tetrahymena thermophila SB210]|uniref:Uncharacterized protein n=1 Tax=Tetrahymena thermophila (strain SB210) TaxID=312017 RepID=W7XKK0_TETTS|nr:hypothetical protein TTHERM_000414157 [Tetrahymena thermophila SB210]EWS76601.1 hypothetical protein TTHERM_000414157 [Tetrahymena thermophila SB210]|eukprot:XP_012650887.1 hypothetical protein TTHERM_000414157 [Tetrahymena thermophila SB210]
MQETIVSIQSIDLTQLQPIKKGQPQYNISQLSKTKLSRNSELKYLLVQINSPINYEVNEQTDQSSSEQRYSYKNIEEIITALLYNNLTNSQQQY